MLIAASAMQTKYIPAIQKATIRAVLLPSMVSLHMGWPRHQGQWAKLGRSQSCRPLFKMDGKPTNLPVATLHVGRDPPVGRN